MMITLKDCAEIITGLDSRIIGAVAMNEIKCPTCKPGHIHVIVVASGDASIDLDKLMLDASNFVPLTVQLTMEIVTPRIFDQP